MSIKAVVKKTKSGWEIVYTDKELAPYSYKLGDFIYSTTCEYLSLPKHIRRAIESYFAEHGELPELIETSISIEDLLGEGFSIVRRSDLTPIAINPEDLMQADQLYDINGLPIEEDHPQSPLMMEGLI